MRIVFPFQALHIFSSLVPLFEATDFIGPLYVVLAFLGPGSIVNIVRLLLAFTIDLVWPCYSCKGVSKGVPYLVRRNLFPRPLCPFEWENGERTISFSRSWNVGSHSGVKNTTA